MDGGYIKLWRKLIDSPVFADDVLLKVWIWCLMKANHKDTTKAVTTGRGATLVNLSPGEFVFGRLTASKELRLPPSTVRNKIACLQKHGNISTKSDTHWSIISIVNWDTYQGDGTGNRTGNRTGKGQAKDTDKNVKNEKKLDSKEKIIVTAPAITRKSFIHPTIEEVQAYCDERGNSVDAHRWYDHYTAKGWKIGKATMKDWKAAVRTWERNEKPADDHYDPFDVMMNRGKND